MSKIKEMIKNKEVVFCYYRDGELWYITQCGFMFPVPVNDIGNATFNSTDKAILFMRWIRKHIKYLEDAKNETKGEK